MELAYKSEARGPNDSSLRRHPGRLLSVAALFERGDRHTASFKGRHNWEGCPRVKRPEILDS